jgi:hypothetical protein
MKAQKKYSISLYTGGINIKHWSRLKKAEKEKALKKNRYICWSYRNPETGYLGRQDNIKAGVNYYKTKEIVILLKLIQFLMSYSIKLAL